MNAVMVYVTAATLVEAQAISAAIVADRLAACANILPAMQSVYHWEGKVETAQEVVVLFKTRDTLFPALEARIKELHSYQTPCIVALPIVAGHGPYLEWLMAETKP